MNTPSLSQPGLAFRKGHGTGNDFIVIADPDDAVFLSPAHVAALCDRRLGIGADGILRAVKAQFSGLTVADSDRVEWFMDYRNADGSFAEMCGNGARVFARFLRDRELVQADEFKILTRGGIVAVRLHGVRDVEVDMGPAQHDVHAAPVVTIEGRTWVGTAVHMPNPHCVVRVESLQDAGPLQEAPRVVPASVFPDGVNVEFVVEHSPTHISMRVHERGSGETLSCGTGACAAAYAHAHHYGRSFDTWSIQVDVAGGTVWVSRRADGRILLDGPTEFVADGVINASWLARQ